jgi:hypothetical protein
LAGDALAECGQADNPTVDYQKTIVDAEAETSLVIFVRATRPLECIAHCLQALQGKIC